VASQKPSGSSNEVLSYSKAIDYSNATLLGITIIAILGLALPNRKKWVFLTLIGSVVFYLACNKKDQINSPEKNVFIRIVHIDADQTVTHSPVIKAEITN